MSLTYALVACVLISFSFSAFAADVTAADTEGLEDVSVSDSAGVEFNSAFLQTEVGKQIDVTRFFRGNPIFPGVMLVDLVVNERWVGRIPVRFTARSADTDARPCVNQSLIAAMGLNSEKLPVRSRKLIAGLKKDGCTDLPTLIQGSSLEYDQSALRLSAVIPQAVLTKVARGYVSPEFWDSGTPTATLAYNGNLSRTGMTQRTTAAYLGLSTGANLGNWHLRNQLAITGNAGKWQVQNISAHILHDIPAMQAQLTLGQGFSDGALFNAFGYRGIALASDDRMHPESRQGYAPEIRGVARTNARVRITQNGSILRETTVPPGPFEINDLYPTGYGGDMTVTISEANGSEESFVVSYASLPQLLRRQRLRYSLIGGEFRQGQIHTGDFVIQGTAQYGLTNALTLYAGGRVATAYRAGLIGAALNTHLGAIAIDATLARSNIQMLGRQQGYSIRASYAKVVPGIKTHISLAAMHFSSSQFWTLETFMAGREADRSRGNGSGLAFLNTSRERNRLQINMSQTLGERSGSLYLSGARTRYWTSEGAGTQIQAGYNNSGHLLGVGFNYGLSFSRQRDDLSGRTNDRALFSLSFALASKPTSPRATVNMVQDDLDGQSSQFSINGLMGVDRVLSYNASVKQRREGVSAGFGLGFRSTFATISASASKGPGFTQMSASANGGVVLHAGGITLANEMGDTIGLVEAKNAKGARIMSGVGTRIDGNGYAVVPFLVPYRLNDVAIDPTGTSLDVELQESRKQIAPRANSVAFVKFETVSGRALVIVAKLPDATDVPFGSRVLDETEADVGIVGQEGQIFIRSPSGQGRLLVKWGDGDDQKCAFDYRQLGSSKTKVDRITSIDKIVVECRPDLALTRNEQSGDRKNGRAQPTPLSEDRS